jgi:hypothetical protein
MAPGRIIYRIRWLGENAEVGLEVWFPGYAGTNAMPEGIFGAVNSGKNHPLPWRVPGAHPDWNHSRAVPRLFKAGWGFRGPAKPPTARGLKKTMRTKFFFLGVRGEEEGN